MTKQARIRQSRLQAMETEFEALLIDCLKECCKGRWGLFGQNAHLDHEDRYWTWAEAKHLRNLASDIRSLRTDIRDSNALSEKFLALCSLKDANTPGEPKLAARFLAEIESV